jgi:hypothetical protein
MDKDIIRSILEELSGNISPEIPYREKLPELSEELKRIAFIESSGGKNKNHEPTTVGLNAGDTAAGSTGLMPITVRETLKLNKDLGDKYSHFNDMTNDELTKHLNNRQDIENEISTSHWNRLGEHFGDNDQRKAYAWRRGITAAKRAPDDVISNEDYVKKYDKRAELDNLKNLLITRK